MSNAVLEYFNNQKGKNIAFCGLGRSNLPLIEMYKKFGANVIACDKRSFEQLGDIAGNLKNSGVELSLGESYLDDLKVDVLFRTPGMNYNMPKLKELRDKGVLVTSEMEVFFEICPCKIIAVTGSDGKTTTTTIISEFLKAEGKNVHLGGNIGKPLLPEIFDIKPDDYAVVELSSFQLISMSKSPDVSVVTNITPNHLDVHKDMQEYIDAKRNIVKYQGKDSVTVLNYSNEITRGFAKNIPSEVRYFNKENSIWRDEISIFFGGEKVLDVKDIAIPGEHNVENYMAAIGAVWGIVSKENILNVAKSFYGVAHRAELVRTLNGVKYYNDSIASSPTRTIKGMLSLFEQKIILICGGYDKNIPYAPLGPVINEKVKALILLGATSPKIEAAVKEAENYNESLDIYHTNSMEEAVKLASEISIKGDIVSLSPASASFDMFKDFEHRGSYFKDLVNAL
ncbi:MAG: UDP-N-acetylmuramoyl-L-alanine--D-glutamate ligase [Clostridia bacterium]|nr:UDP-N-acetylmuramoyl-L-alanine--D-glutamate ligase [Clostridia bacterium]